jgi:uncharacterized protein YqhQ
MTQKKAMFILAQVLIITLGLKQMLFLLVPYILKHLFRLLQHKY